MSESEPRLDSLSLPFVEGLYADYLRDPRSVPADWREYFDKLSGRGSRGDGFKIGPSFHSRSVFYYDRETGRGAPTVGGGPAFRETASGTPTVREVPGTEVAGTSATREYLEKQFRVDLLIRNYRVRGHIIARTNPLGIVRPTPRELDFAASGLAEADLDRPFVFSVIDGVVRRPLREILDRLRNTYCRSIGVQFYHIDDLAERLWLQRQMERTENRCQLGRAEQIRILSRLTDATTFEEAIHKRFVGAKSFSLAGAETLIPLLDMAIERAGEQGADDIVFAMPHRGRLNVLANIIGKSAREIFREFEDADPELYLHGGDVKYHQGYSGDWTTAGGRKVHLSLCFNPSHLEFIGPVAMGRVRAKQDRAGDSERRRKLGIQIHGDAGFIGEGIVQETLNLSGLAGYRVGGTIHVVIDNQVGFTASPRECRTSTYCTEVARMLQAPIFQVNGEDPEAVAQVVRLAMDFRCRFQRDVVISMICYRRHGHNESDEPRFTQPMLYRLIDQRQSVREGYLEHLLKLGELTVAEAERIAAESRQRLERDLAAPGDAGGLLQHQYEASVWHGYVGGLDRAAYDVPTGVAREELSRLLEKLSGVPEGFHPHRTIERFLAGRRQMAAGERALDWSAAEALAFATLATAGHRVRLTGQDTARGTFSQRHAVLHDSQTGQTYEPLGRLATDQGPVEILNSPLSEAGVLGFEYGYSLDDPGALVLWEAQFGDFCNAAQVIIDQFISSAQDKWCRLSGLVLLLPHGLEGMGPEHSSGRLERFLQLAAEDNVQVVNLTTPGQYFHCLRRQVLRRWRKPLVVMTPKGLLRHPAAVSSLDDLAAGEFQRVIPDEASSWHGRDAHDDHGRDARATSHGQDARATGERARPRRLLLCSGKIYYELAERRRQLEQAGTLAAGAVAIVRVEQLYPLATEWLEAALAGYPDGVPACWVQEEPENMGAWRFIQATLGQGRSRLLGRFPLTAVCRPAMTSPASGSASSHKLGQEKLLAEAFAGM